MKFPQCVKSTFCQLCLFHYICGKKIASFSSDSGAAAASQPVVSEEDFLRNLANVIEKTSGVYSNIDLVRLFQYSLLRPFYESIYHIVSCF